MKFFILYINIFLLLNCAAQGTASGGPEDLEGPKLLSIDPPNKSQNIPLDQKIVLTFNELIDPISIQNAIKVSHAHTIKVRGRHIIIKPKKNWTKNKILSIYLSRKIRDYQKNTISKPIQLAYNTNNEKIINTKIIGEIIGHKKESIIEVGLFNYPINEKNEFIQKVEVDNKGIFEFNFIDYGKYTIGAIETNLININEQIRRKKYSMLTKDYIHLTKSNELENIKMFLSDPIEKLKITSIKMSGQYDVDLIFNDLSEEKYIIDTLLTPGDSIKINLIKSNRLETYSVPEFNFILPEIIDTIGPKIINHEKNENMIFIEFSEPIRIKSNGIINENNQDAPINFTFNKSNEISIPVLKNGNEKIKLLGNYLTDINGNSMIDSIKYISFSKNINKNDEIIGGNIIGSIIYSGKETIILEAQNTKTNEIHTIYADGQNFKLNNLEAGMYKLWAFEALHNNNDFTYFSGTWEPYHHAARFTIYPDSIDVRARWDIKGITIEFD